MRERRRVRVTEAFFDQLDALLGDERGRLLMTDGSIDLIGITIDQG